MLEADRQLHATSIATDTNPSVPTGTVEASIADRDTFGKMIGN